MRQSVRDDPLSRLQSEHAQQPGPGSGATGNVSARRSDDDRFFEHPGQPVLPRLPAGDTHPRFELGPRQDALSVSLADLAHAPRAEWALAAAILLGAPHGSASMRAAEDPSKRITRPWRGT